MSDLSKRFSIHSSFSSLNSFFLLPDLLHAATRRLNLLAKVPINVGFFRGLIGRNFSDL